MGQYSESCNGPFGKIYLLAIFLGLQTVILIATVPDMTGKKEHIGFIFQLLRVPFKSKSQVSWTCIYTCIYLFVYILITL